MATRRTTSNDAEARPLPTSARGVRTRASLVGAARLIFARDGYVRARITDISEQAEVAAGSFYTYFNSKEEIFAAVFEEVQEEMLHPQMAESDNHDDIVGLIEANNRAYLSLYRSNASLMAVIEQVVTINDEFRTLRRERGRAFAARNARSIRRLQQQGLADPELDPVIAARAISGMVSRLAYATYVLEDSVPFEKLVSTTTRLWLNALRIPVEAASLQPAAPPAAKIHRARAPRVKAN